MVEVQTLIHQVQTEMNEGKSAEEIFHTLTPFFGQDMALDRTLAESLGSLPDARIAELLQRLIEISKDRRVRKEIKRSLYRLERRGVTVEGRPSDRGRSILRPLRVEDPQALGGGIDSFGDRFLLLGIPHPGRGLRVIYGVISDTRGWVGGSGGEMGKKGFKAFVEEAQKNSPFPLVEMEPSYVAWLFVRAYELSLRRGKPIPPDYLAFRADVEGLKKDYEKPLVFSFVDAFPIRIRNKPFHFSGELNAS